MTRFTPTTESTSTWLKDTADGPSVTQEKLTEKLGPSNVECDYKSECSWFGEFTCLDGSTVQVACWDWKGSIHDNQVSVWCDDDDDDRICEWVEYLES
jgi:hypothetical protein